MFVTILLKICNNMWPASNEILRQQLKYTPQVYPLFSMVTEGRLLH